MNAPQRESELGADDVNEPRPRRSSSWTSAIVVLVVGALITTALVIGARSVHNANENRLLRQRTREVAAVASAAIPTTQIPLTAAAVLAEATNGNPTSFRGVTQPIIATGRPFTSLSIWPAHATDPRPLVVVGRTPQLASRPPAEIAAYLRRAANASTFALVDLLGTKDRGLGYGAAASKDGRFVVYGESQLPAGRRARIDKNSAFSDLDYALFEGTKRDTQHLLASSTGGALLSGRTSSTTVPFGDSQLLVVLSPHSELGGSLLANLWWMLALLGVALTIAAAALVHVLARRREEAEQLADENARLYATQRSVALSLQHSLLTDEFPKIAGTEIGARYVAGVEDIEIGGDWYDVISLNNDRVMVAVGDVSGRGLAAATTMAALRFAIRAYAAQGDAPATILTKLSDLVSLSRDGHFATTLCARIDLADRTMTCANAGHPEPLLVNGVDATFVATSVGLPVGVRRGEKYAEATQSLPNHGTLLFYTDGLIERRGESLTVGLARLSTAAKNSAGSLEETLSTVLDQTIPEGSADDTALLGVRWNR